MPRADNKAASPRKMPSCSRARKPPPPEIHEMLGPVFFERRRRDAFRSRYLSFFSRFWIKINMHAEIKKRFDFHF